MRTYSVRKLAQLSGVSARTLHYYDHIGLLTPADRTNKGYRYYQEPQLMRLQQILFYKELGFSLQKIRSILDDPEFDLVKTLREHRKALRLKSHRLEKLIKTIDSTVEKLTNKEAMKDEELYAGFTKEERKAYRKEATERWGEETIQKSESQLRNLGSQGFKKLKAEGEGINQTLAMLTHLDPKDDRVQKTVDLHFRHMNAFREIGLKEYRALGEMYVQDERFTRYYEKYKEGLASFLYMAIGIYCDARSQEAD